MSDEIEKIHLMTKIISRLEVGASKIRGYRNSIVGGFRFKLAPESSYFDYNLDSGVKLTGSHFVRWADMVQMQIYIKTLSNLKNPVVVDVGAHHGLYVLLAGAFCKQVKQGRVLAFEPVTENYDILLKNIALNNLEEWVTPIKKAVGEFCETVRISRSGSQSQLRVHDLINTEIVRQVDLKSGLPEEIKHIDILMIDVEGAELPVLKGFPWERTEVSNIFCEFHPYAWKDFSYTATDMSDFMSAHGLQAIDMFQQDQTECRSEHYVGPTLFRKIKPKNENGTFDKIC